VGGYDLLEKKSTSMVDITGKPDIIRKAIAEGTIKLKHETILAIEEDRIRKGNVRTAAELAGINGVKKTTDVILLAHLIPITSVNVSLQIDRKQSTVKATVEVKSIGKTGVELEAIMGVMMALLAIFDMCKYLEKDENGQYAVTRISDVRVVTKKKESV
jgi:cyclic pyranopterin phosphate synthase